MRWVVEDYDALARLLEAARPWSDDETAREPGRLILRLRSGLQWSQAELAKRSGVSRSLVARAEAGGDLQLGSLRRLFAALGCSLVILPVSPELHSRFNALAEAEKLRDQKRAQFVP